jgi:hypothetical protein
MRRPPPEVPSLEAIRQILRGEKPTDTATPKPTGKYFVSAAAFKGLLLAVKDTEQRVSARATGEIPVEFEGRVWRVVRSTAIKSGIQIEYEA